MLLKHSEKPALPGGFRNTQAEREMCPGSIQHPSSWRPDPGSEQLPEMLFLKERKAQPRSESYGVAQGPGAGKGSNRASLRLLRLGHLAEKNEDFGTLCWLIQGMRSQASISHFILGA